MKNLFLLLTVFLSLTSCEKKEDPNLTPIEQLPPKTQIGANTAGCLINGNIFLPRGGFFKTNLTFQYTNQKDFILGIVQRNDDSAEYIYIYVYDTSLEENKTYSLGEGNIAGSKSGEYRFPISNIYSTTSDVNGELIITNHNFNNATMSGTFWFDAINDNGEKVEIREGRFDMEY